MIFYFIPNCKTNKLFGSSFPLSVSAGRGALVGKSCSPGSAAFGVRGLRVLPHSGRARQHICIVTSTSAFSPSFCPCVGLARGKRTSRRANPADLPPHHQVSGGLECFYRQPSWFDGGFYTNARHYLVNLARIECNFAWSKSLLLELKVPLRCAAHLAVSEQGALSGASLMGVLRRLWKGRLLGCIGDELGRSRGTRDAAGC